MVCVCLISMMDTLDGGPCSLQCVGGEFTKDEEWGTITESAVYEVASVTGGTSLLSLPDDCLGIVLSYVGPRYRLLAMLTCRRICRVMLSRSFPPWESNCKGLLFAISQGNKPYFMHWKRVAGARWTSVLQRWLECLIERCLAHPNGRDEIILELLKDGNVLAATVPGFKISGNLMITLARRFSRDKDSRDEKFKSTYVDGRRVQRGNHTSNWVAEDIRALLGYFVERGGWQGDMSPRSIRAFRADLNLLTNKPKTKEILSKKEQRKKKQAQCSI